MPLTTTSVGRGAAQSAEAGGYRLNLAEFAVTEFNVTTLDDQRTALLGTQTYRGRIVAIEAIRSNLMRFTCEIPQGLPSTGEWLLKEIGIFTDSGTLFAHGYFPNIYAKKASFGAKFYVYVTLAKADSVVNVTTSDSYSMASASSVRALLKPSEARQNAVAVLDAQQNSEEQLNLGDATKASPTIAVKFGSGGNEWGFVGMERVHRGQPSAVASASLFTIPTGARGFWLNHDEVIVAQVISGPGAGQSRKCKFNKATNQFAVLEQAFTALNTTSLISIWRAPQQNIPSRTPDIPAFAVLGVGENSYSAIVSASGVGKLVPRYATLTSNGGASYNIPTGDIPAAALADDTQIIVTVNEVVRPPSQYSTSGSVLTLSPSPNNGDTIQVRAFEYVAGTEGGELLFQEAKYTSDGTTNAYSFPSVPLNDNYAHVYVQGKLLAKTKYTITGAGLAFTSGNIPANGVVFYLVSFGHYEDGISRSTLTRDEVNVTGTTSEITTTQLIEDYKQVSVFMDSAYVSRSDYTVLANKVVLKQSVTGTHRFDVLNFRAVFGTEVTSVTGADKGPVWIDPAGSEGSPNKLVPQLLEYNGGQLTYTVAAVPDKNHIHIFVNGKGKSPSLFTWSQANNTVTLDASPGGAKIDIYCFTSVDNAGTQAAGRSTTLTSTGSSSFTIHTNADLGSLRIKIDGVYIHRRDYTYTPGSGQVVLTSAPVSGQIIDAWSYTDTNAAGMRARVSALSTRIFDGRTRYSLPGAPTNKNGLLAVLTDSATPGSGVEYHHNAFTFSTINNLPHLVLTSAPASTLNGQEIVVYTLWSSAPRLRLVRGADADAIYLRADQNLWDVIDREEAKRALGVGSLANTYLQRASNLSDLSDVAQARVNLGLAPTDLNGIYLQRNSNLSDLGSASTSRTNLGVYSKTESDNLFLAKASNFSDVPNKPQARTNLGLGTAATYDDSRYLQRANNLSDLTDAAAARSNLGLGAGSTAPGGTYLATANNLSDVPNKPQARTNLGLGTAALSAATDFLSKANNLSDLQNVATARSNLGLDTTYLKIASNLSDLQNITAALNNLGALAKAGGTMTGPLTLSGAPTQSLHAATRQFVLDNVYTPPYGYSQSASNNTIAVRDSIGRLQASGFLGTSASITNITATQIISDYVSLIDGYYLVTIGATGNNGILVRQGYLRLTNKMVLNFGVTSGIGSDSARQITFSKALTDVVCAGATLNTPTGYGGNVDAWATIRNVTTTGMVVRNERVNDTGNDGQDNNNFPAIWWWSLGYLA